MKKISILVNCYNEVDNVVPLSQAIVNEMTQNLPTYAYELVFIDNFSTDGTRQKLELLCLGNKRIKAIFNAKNFGQSNSPYYGLCQTTGDCTITMCSDFQDPVEMIHQFVDEWEKGYKIVIGIKNDSQENRAIYFLRSCYYRLIKKIASVEQIEHFSGYGLYDKCFIDVVRKLDDPAPYFRGIVAELGPQRKELNFTQPQRKHGKTHNNWYTLYDLAMLGFTSYTKVGLRIATITGFVFSAINMIIAMLYFIAKLIWWDKFPFGTAPMLIGVFFMGSIQIFFIGLLGEYIMNINTRIMHRPLVVEEKRINFD